MAESLTCAVRESTGPKTKKLPRTCTVHSRRRRHTHEEIRVLYAHWREIRSKPNCSQANHPLCEPSCAKGTSLLLISADHIPRTPNRLARLHPRSATTVLHSPKHTKLSVCPTFEHQPSISAMLFNHLFNKSAVDISTGRHFPALNDPPCGIKLALPNMGTHSRSNCRSSTPQPTKCPAGLPLTEVLQPPRSGVSWMDTAFVSGTKNKKASRGARRGVLGGAR